MIIDIVVIFQMDYRKWNKQDTIVYKIIYIYIYIYIYLNMPFIVMKAQVIVHN